MIMDFNLSLEINRDVGDRIKKKSSLRLYRKEANSFPSIEMNVTKKKQRNKLNYFNLLMTADVRVV